MKIAQLHPDFFLTLRLYRYSPLKIQVRELDNFNPEEELTIITEVRRVAKRKAFRVSKLNEFRSEIVALHKTGASLADIATWLRLNTRITAVRSTVSRFLKSLPELQNNHLEEKANG